MNSLTNTPLGQYILSKTSTLLSILLIVTLKDEYVLYLVSSSNTFTWMLFPNTE